MDGGLPCRVTAANDEYAAIAARTRFARRGAVVDAGSGTRGDPFGGVLSVSHARCGENGAAQEFTAVGERHSLIVSFRGQTRDTHRDHELGTKALGLRHGASRQFASADARRETQIVFDSRTLGSLTSGTVP